MASHFVEQFMRKLQQIEKSKDPGPLVELFADDAELSNLTRHEPRRGRDGAAEFWSDYLKAFDHIHSDFHSVVEGEKSAAMEWTADGAVAGGKPISYRGISVIETDGDRVKRFRTYYDTAAFVAPAATTGTTNGRG